jgi:predicted hotdog family 3-hydroxylacyl-ACP dehydratase
MPQANTSSIDAVLPYAGRMLLLDELRDHGPDHVTCGVTVHDQAMFCESGHGVPAWVGLEYMAQTCCAFSGLEDLVEGRKPSIGLLLGSRNYESEVEFFPVGAELTIRAELVLRDESDLVAFVCVIHDREQILARGDVKAYRPKDVLAVIRGSR